MNNNKQSSVVDWIFSQLPDEYTTTRSGFDVYQKAKEMQKQQAQNYAEFCVMCDREKLPLLDFESFILTYGGNK